MKSLFALMIVLFSLNTFAGAQIALDPGSKITITAGDTMVVSCSGTSSSSSQAECIISNYNTTDKYGTYCNYSSSYLCAVVYKYGTKTEWNYFYNGADAANFCDSKLKN